jgi:glycosyltransferase involved in cell wall biosynthesis
MHIAVCALTYKRPDGLQRLLEGLNALTFEQRACPDISVIIVDNEGADATRAICDEMRPNFRWSLTYVVEQRRGISYGRNRAIATVPKTADFVAFIDDDEVPVPEWLDVLLTVQDTYTADVVWGPSLPHYMTDQVPEWIATSKVFGITRHPTGHPLTIAATNNVLIRADIFTQFDPPFDDRFATTGGEDTHLFMRLHQAGYRFVWADEAVVNEWIPASRLTLSWMVQRHYRAYSTYSLCEMEVSPPMQVMPRRFLTGCGRILLGLLLLPFSVLNRSLFVEALLQVSRGAGLISGLMGRRYEEYQTVHGT